MLTALSPAMNGIRVVENLENDQYFGKFYEFYWPI